MKRKQTPKPDASTAREEVLFAGSDCKVIAAVDEVGRGALAGPVAVCAVAIIKGKMLKRPVGVRDSKKMTALQRQRVYEQLIACPGLEYTVVMRDHTVIDQVNIFNATMEAMTEAVTKLRARPSHVLIDGPQRPPGLQNYLVECIVHGDQECWAIAAASIIAKVTRDRLMIKFSRMPAYLPYRFDSNKGYGTAVHLETLKVLGPSDIHRRSFAPVRECSIVNEATEAI